MLNQTLTKERDEATKALVKEKDCHAVTKELLKQSQAAVTKLHDEKAVAEYESKRNEAMAMEVVRHLYFSVKLDGSGKRDGSWLIGRKWESLLECYSVLVDSPTLFYLSFLLLTTFRL